MGEQGAIYDPVVESSQQGPRRRRFQPPPARKYGSQEEEDNAIDDELDDIFGRACSLSAACVSKTHAVLWLPSRGPLCPAAPPPLRGFPS